MAEAAPNLRVVDEHGELADYNVQALLDEIAGLQRDIRGWRTRYANLKRDKDAEARNHQHWPDAVRLFAYWKRKTGSKRGQFDADRFFLLLPHLERHGVAYCQRAIDGRVFDHFSTKRKNGSTKHFWEFERIFKNADEATESWKRVPQPYEPEPLDARTDESQPPEEEK